jgi:DNA replicative helicase MCM subunit Mcm2 (Cdc46/Mcm family)
VEISGVLKIENLGQHSLNNFQKNFGKNNKMKCVFNYYLEANNLEVLPQNYSPHLSPANSPKLALENFTILAQKDGFFSLLVNSIAPDLRSNFLLKTSVLLSLVSKSIGPAQADEKNTRLHLLVLGQQEELKNQLLEWVSALDIGNTFIDNKSKKANGNCSGG